MKLAILFSVQAVLFFSSQASGQAIRIDGARVYASFNPEDDYDLFFGASR